MAGGGDNRTEKPTSRRLQKAREKGKVPRSKEVPSSVVLLGSLMVLFYYGRRIVSVLEQIMREYLTFPSPADISVSFMSRIFGSLGYQMAIAVGPLLLVALVLAIGSNLAQSGLVLSWEAVGFHFEKLNPSNGLGRIFSSNGVMELLKSLTMLVVISILSYSVISRYTPLYPRLVLMDVRQLIYWTGWISFEVYLRVAVFLILLAIADYAFQRHRFMESLKMTKQEVKDERKDMEGDPYIKARIRRIQLEMARRRMMTDVPTADVVITNPTHYAVALSYKMESMEAPRVVAKGVGYLALKIKELAQKHDVPMVENKPLAQTLYKSVEIGDFIPTSLFRAVAEILAYIYKARNAWRR
ncbi:MAG TPA: flagellar biosynthesis protein FlhB [Acidobacteriota bacterium]|nr:flagellar biosynthesis protein FlhB [Acidobacteriota bacterium]